MPKELSQFKQRVAFDRMQALCEAWAADNGVDITTREGQRAAVDGVVDALGLGSTSRTSGARLVLSHLSEMVPLDKVRRTSAARRARKAAAVTAPIDRQAIIVRDGSRCYICGTDVTPGKEHLDHVIPLSRGGAHTPANLRLACARCNLRKGAMTPSEYAATLVDCSTVDRR